ncbi:MAG: CheF family chemotaxis protein [Halanaeroarchaeum sp.]
MSDDVVADFVTDLIPDTAGYEEPVRGRVLMNQEQVVLATANERVSISLADVFDLQYGSAPDDMRRFFGDTVTIGYRRNDRRAIAMIQGEGETVERFATLLFKAILNDSTVLLRHPAKVGGRVTDASLRRARIGVRPGAVRFVTDDTFSIDVSTVVHFERVDRELDGTTRPVLSVRHRAGDETVTTELALSPPAKMNVLGRFLRIEYSQLREELEDVSLQEAELEVLVGLYSGATRGNLAGMLGVDASRVSMLIDSLREKGLLEETDSGYALTATGRMAVGERIEDVNI